MNEKQLKLFKKLKKSLKGSTFILTITADKLIEILHEDHDDFDFFTYSIDTFNKRNLKRDIKLSRNHIGNYICDYDKKEKYKELLEILDPVLGIE